MKKNLLAVLVIMAAFLISCEKEDNISFAKMRINHYQQPVNMQELYTGLSFKVQEGSQIGKEEWYGFSNRISGFEYELGYIYDIVVQKEKIENPMVDMPSVKYSLVKVNSKSKVPQETTFTITLAINYFNGFESLVVENESSNYTLLGETEIDCGELCDALEENIKNENGMVGTFKHIDRKTIQLLELEVQEDY
ncbi:DUF4377 domain-containing protein [Sunxiuqinia elliptica]|uniref:DUF4377 domain-containing protein n=1 Tax=Sunxiuqinia elliptica TaxID=655355 RepID=A0A1I2HMF4_9BACT|nr:DUF4377 domain-containing protein [Sunxiuqinia elliptica]SFF31284.1 protein of unknown function [Sunxiuqinia elliptica]